MDILQTELANGKRIGEAMGFGYHIIKQPQDPSCNATDSWGIRGCTHDVASSK